MQPNNPNGPNNPSAQNYYSQYPQQANPQQSAPQQPYGRRTSQQAYQQSYQQGYQQPGYQAPAPAPQPAQEPPRQRFNVDSGDNHDIRAKARQMLRRFFSTVILLNLVMVLVSGALANTGSIFSIVSLVMSLNEQGGMPEKPTELIKMVSDAFSGNGTVAIFSLLGTVLSGVMSVGLALAMVRMANGEAINENVLFSRWKNAVGCVVLPIWIKLRTALYVVPGVLVILLGLLVLDSSGFLGGLIMVIGVLAAVGMTFIAYLNFTMSTYVYAEHPEMSVCAAVNRSRDIMNGSKMKLLLLILPYLLIDVALVVGCFVLNALIYGILPDCPFFLWLSILSYPAVILGVFCISVLMSMATACFYNAHK